MQFQHLQEVHGRNHNAYTIQHLRGPRHPGSSLTSNALTGRPAIKSLDLGRAGLAFGLLLAYSQ